MGIGQPYSYPMTSCHPYATFLVAAESGNVCNQTAPSMVMTNRTCLWYIQSQMGFPTFTPKRKKKSFGWDFSLFPYILGC